MALFHFHVDQIGRSAGRSAVACAAYRSGEKLYSEYYGETSDYTRKGGVMYSEIMLPPHAPMAYADRQTLWNAVEKVERRHDAQLAYEELKSLQEKLNTFKFKKRREQFKQEHESDFRRFYFAKRKLKESVPDGEPPVDVWKNELSQLEQEYRQQSAQASLLWKESKKLRELQVLVDEVLRKQGQREREQQHSDRHQDKQEERLW